VAICAIAVAAFIAGAAVAADEGTARDDRPAGAEVRYAGDR
jgi:hypothetical protein